LTEKEALEALMLLLKPTLMGQENGQQCPLREELNAFKTSPTE
jgi:hypothetical protein